MYYSKGNCHRLVIVRGRVMCCVTGGVKCRGYRSYKSIIVGVTVID